MTPTLNMGRILAYLDREDHSKDAALAYIGPGLRKTYDWRVERAAKATPTQVAARHKEYELSKQVMPMLVAAGIPILAGTDAGYLNSFNYPGQGMHDELERYVESGLTPRQALVSATITGPAFLGHGDRYGSLAGGKTADILILDANPLEDIKATRAIRGVVLHGKWLDRAALDGLLARGESQGELDGEPIPWRSLAPFEGGSHELQPNSRAGRGAGRLDAHHAGVDGDRPPHGLRQDGDHWGTIPRGSRGVNLDGRAPDEAQWPSHNYNHLMEQPTIFYAIALTLALMDMGGGINSGSPGVMSASRIIHSIVQCDREYRRDPLSDFRVGVVLPARPDGSRRSAHPARLPRLAASSLAKAAASSTWVDQRNWPTGRTHSSR